jgi:3D (Asp-Asp-Asp) domain-containing protein
MMNNIERALFCVMGVVVGAFILVFRCPKTEIVEVEREVYVVTATVYHAVKGQCDDSPLVTASGAKISSAESAYEHRYLAVSRDLLDVFPYGTKVEVSGCGELDGVYTVADTLNKRYKGYIDLLINPDMRGGKWEGVRIKKVE